MATQLPLLTVVRCRITAAERSLLLLLLLLLQLVGGGPGKLVVQLSRFTLHLNHAARHLRLCTPPTDSTKTNKIAAQSNLGTGRIAARQRIAQKNPDVRRCTLKKLKRGFFIDKMFRAYYGTPVIHILETRKPSFKVTPSNILSRPWFS